MGGEGEEGEGEGEAEIASAAGGLPPSPPWRAKLLPLALCERFPVLINLRAALNSRVQRTRPPTHARTDANVTNMRSAIIAQGRRFHREAL